MGHFTGNHGFYHQNPSKSIKHIQIVSNMVVYPVKMSHHPTLGFHLPPLDAGKKTHLAALPLSILVGSLVRLASSDPNSLLPRSVHKIPYFLGFWPVEPILFI